MITRVLASSLLAVTLYGADPKPIPPERHEEVSRVLIALQQAQLKAREAKIAAYEAIEMEGAAVQAWLKKQQELRKELGVEDNCDLAFDKTWVCKHPKEAVNLGK